MSIRSVGDPVPSTGPKVSSAILSALLADGRDALQEPGEKHGSKSSFALSGDLMYGI
jgi:hypothetical protein